MRFTGCVEIISGTGNVRNNHAGNPNQNESAGTYHGPSWLLQNESFFHGGAIRTPPCQRLGRLTSTKHRLILLNLQPTKGNPRPGGWKLDLLDPHSCFRS